MLQRVVEQCRKARLIDEVFVATDHDRVFEAARRFGACPLMTSRDHISGTDRVAEAARKIQTTIIVNVQGDEPLISPRAIDALALALASDPRIQIATLACRLSDAADWDNPNVVKVVVNRFGQALYFSRCMIPYVREKKAMSKTKFLKHLGIYAYRRKFLLRWPRLSPTPLEYAEKLEQLRVLEYRIPIQVIETRWNSVGVDVPADLDLVEARLKARS